MEEQRRRDVVRQIADHMQWLAVFRQRAEIERQCVAGVNGQPFGWELLP